MPARSPPPGQGVDGVDRRGLPHWPTCSRTMIGTAHCRCPAPRRSPSRSGRHPRSSRGARTPGRSRRRGRWRSSRSRVEEPGGADPRRSQDGDREDDGAGHLHEAGDRQGSPEPVARRRGSETSVNDEMYWAKVANPTITPPRWAAAPVPDRSGPDRRSGRPATAPSAATTRAIPPAETRKATTGPKSIPTATRW